MGRRNIIDYYIDKRRYKLQKKIKKHQEFADWWYNIVNGKSYKNVSLCNKLKMYIHGFDSDSYKNYDLENNNYKEYLTEVERWKSREINGQYKIILDDKRLFYEVFSSHIKIPKTILNIVNNVITDYNTQQEISLEDMLEYIKKYKGLAFRPTNNGGGKYVSVVIAKENDTYEINGKITNREDTLNFLKTQCDDIVTEYVFQHEYSANIFSGSVNTIRIVTTHMKNGDCIIPLALHRFGVEKSRPVDNACSGGIFGVIDIDTGKIGPCKSYLTEDVYSKHPDTGAQIDGIIVPRWDEIKEKILEVAQKFPYVKFVAWDVVLTDDGVTVIEGNASTGFGFFQMFKPERNTKLGEFYRENGILDK